jgi:hypothetical protein
MDINFITTMIKIKYQGQARIFRLVDQTITVAELREKARGHFRELPERFVFVFVD